MRGADDLLDAFCEAAGADAHEADHGGASSADGEFFVNGFECLGACDIAPMASIDERYYGPLDAGDAQAASSSCAPARERAAGEGARERAAAGGPEPSPRRAAEDGRCLRRGSSSEHVDEPGLRTIDGYRRLGGYRALETAFREMEPDELLGELEDSGLRGRGGAGFSMGKKASFLPARRDGEVPLLQRRRVRAGRLQGPRADAEEPAPADRGDRDRGARRRRRPRLHLHPRRVRRQVADILDARRRRGLRGRLPRARTSSAPARDVELVVHRGAGAYICGEETALLDALEGKRGNPRLKPPFPAIQGLYGGPTLINNVETLSNVPHIVANGAEWFKGFGTEQSPGTKVVSVSGCVQRPGNYEVELGIPSRELIYDLAGGPARGPRGQGLVPGRLLVAGADRRPSSTSPTASRRWPRRARCSARARSSSPTTRVSIPAAGAAHGALLPPRVVRQVHPLPRGHQLDGEDARAGGRAARRRRWTSTSSPRCRRTSSATASACSATRWRCRSARWCASSASEFEEAIDAARRPAPGARRRRPIGADRRAGALEPRHERRAQRDHARRRRASRSRPTEGEMLVDAAKHGDVEIPVFCYEPKLGEPVGACRMCLVEIEGIPKLQTACSTPVRDGMVVYTRTDQVKEAQSAVVEFLLVNHPLDCPVCDKGGECPLQDIAMGWGAGQQPRHRPQAPLPEADAALAAGRDRPRALHPLLPLRALQPGGRRGRAAAAARARRRDLRRHLRRPPLHRALPRQHHRALPGRAR